VPASRALADPLLPLLGLLLVPLVPLELVVLLVVPVEPVGRDAVLPVLVLTALSLTDASLLGKASCASLPGSESQGSASPSGPLPHAHDKVSRSRAQAPRVSLAGKLGVRR
jgi:hypothetical protein